MLKASCKQIRSILQPRDGHRRGGHRPAIQETAVNKKEQIIEKLKENGCRITKQRLMLIDIILENDCSSCKEIYYKALKEDDRIGVARVYRMVNALEEAGAISRKNMYKIDCPEDADSYGEGCEIVLDDDTTYHLSEGNWNKVVSEGLRHCGYLKDQKIVKIKIDKIYQ